MAKFKLNRVSKLFVERHLKSLKRNKSPGLDDSPPQLLKDCSTSITEPLTFVINLSLSTGIVPTIWKTGKITPIHKSGTTDTPDNYRPISVLPTLSKILEQAVHSRLIEYLESNRLLNPEQFGYRKKRSTKLASTLFIDDIRRSLDSGQMVGAVFLDLTKASDLIGHNVLLDKLYCYGISGGELDWFTDYLFNRKQLANLNNNISDYHSIKQGVPQGSILGPLLFLIFFNDITEQINHTKIIMYADDTVIYFASKNITTIKYHLNEDIDQISKYFFHNELILNLKKGKTESMCYSEPSTLSKSHEHLVNYQVNYRGIPIKTVNSYTYLGSMVDNHLTLISDFDKTYKKVSNRLRLLDKIK